MVREFVNYFFFKENLSHYECGGKYFFLREFVKKNFQAETFFFSEKYFFLNVNLFENSPSSYALLCSSYISMEFEAGKIIFLEKAQMVTNYVTFCRHTRKHFFNVNLFQYFPHFFL